MNPTVRAQLQREEATKAIDKAVEDYYTSLSPEDLAELAEWGEFALTEFPEHL